MVAGEGNAADGDISSVKLNGVFTTGGAVLILTL
jgi:hypothetical protein